MVLGGLVLGSLILYLKGMRTMMFQLSGYYYSGTLKGNLGGNPNPSSRVGNLYPFGG